MWLSFPLPDCGKNDQRISENIQKYSKKSEVVFKCIFVIRNNMNMVKITGGLSKMFSQLSGTTRYWKKRPKNKWKYLSILFQKLKSFWNAFCFQKWFEHDQIISWAVKNDCPVVTDNQTLGRNCQKKSENI